MAERNKDAIYPATLVDQVKAAEKEKEARLKAMGGKPAASRPPGVTNPGPSGSVRPLPLAPSPNDYDRFLDPRAVREIADENEQ